MIAADFRFRLNIIALVCVETVAFRPFSKKCTLRKCADLNGGSAGPAALNWCVKTPLCCDPKLKISVREQGQLQVALRIL